MIFIGLLIIMFMLAIPVGFVWLIINLIRKKGKKKPIFLMIGSVIMVFLLTHIFVTLFPEEMEQASKANEAREAQELILEQEEKEAKEKEESEEAAKKQAEKESKAKEKEEKEAKKKAEKEAKEKEKELKKKEAEKATKEESKTQETETESESESEELTEDEFKEKCESISYDDLARYPDTYDGEMVKVVVSVDQVQSGNFLFADCYLCTESSSGKEIGLVDRRESKEPKLLENDKVTVYGYSEGLTQITRTNYVLGNKQNTEKFDVPNIGIEYVEIQ